MFDLGTSFLSVVERDPGALAVVDDQLRLSYAQWYRRISAVVAACDELGLKPGDHLVTVLQNRWEAATIHWACQFAGIICTPINWRSTADEVDYCLADSEAKAVVFGHVSADSVRRSHEAASRRRVVLGVRQHDEIAFDAIIEQGCADATPRADADSWSVMLYTSGTTAKPKGVPRRHCAERAAAIAHVAQNQYARSERTLGVMPLYHTMGVRSLLAMALIDGTDRKS